MPPGIVARVVTANFVPRNGRRPIRHVRVERKVPGRQRKAEDSGRGLLLTPTWWPDSDNKASRKLGISAPNQRNWYITLQLAPKTGNEVEGSVPA